MAIGNTPGKGREAAEELGLRALVFMSEDGDRLAHFMNETGFTPETLSATAEDPSTLAAVLDHLLSDESLLLVFAAGEGLDPSSIGPARALLPGGDAELYATAHSAPPPPRRTDKLPLPKRRARTGE